MILYRVRGKAEIFKGCGMVDIIPDVGTNEIKIRQRFKQFAKTHKQKNTSYNICLEQLNIKKIMKKDLVELFQTGDPNSLLSSFKTIDLAKNV